MSDDLPAGAATFQSSAPSEPGSLGGRAVSETPKPFGPRNIGQSDAVARANTNKAAAIKENKRNTIGDRSKQLATVKPNLLD